ncbi:unnamed protein product [Dibothriocephalus latus]|uniref:Uncharacterized protein n=1 Tax=Dibothriocephalus latus TaxID=60516 RepID=A0A3P7LRM8_DIBLA|nr:unnamed protein product [Dibothriocephalus latus]
MQDFAGLLYERRYIGSVRFDDETANRNSYNLSVFRAVLAGALYPNFVMLTERPPKYAFAFFLACVFYLWLHFKHIWSFKTQSSRVQYHLMEGI